MATSKNFYSSLRTQSIILQDFFCGTLRMEPSCAGLIFPIVRVCLTFMLLPVAAVLVDNQGQDKNV